MRSIHNYAYAALLALAGLNLAPNLASAQEAVRGKFTLTHDVRWESALVPAGEYGFTLDSNGVMSVLVLNKMNGPRAGFLLAVHDMDEERNTPGTNRLVLKTVSADSYVSTMLLPEFGKTLHFRVPSPKQEARAMTAASGGAQ